MTVFSFCSLEVIADKGLVQFQPKIPYADANAADDEGHEEHQACINLQYLANMYPDKVLLCNLAAQLGSTGTQDITCLYSDWRQEQKVTETEYQMHCEPLLQALKLVSRLVWLEAR